MQSLSLIKWIKQKIILIQRTNVPPTYQSVSFYVQRQVIYFFSPLILDK